MTIQIYDPTIEAKSRHIAYAPRPKSLAGLRVGLVDNSKHNSDQLLARIAGLLERDYGAKAHVMRRKSSAGVPASPEIIEEFKNACDVVVAGIGD
ncbi:MAG: hypothetical protein AAB325_01405 [Pseudomonadota bacterium]